MKPTLRLAVLVCGCAMVQLLPARDACAQSWNYSPFRSIVRFSVGQGFQAGQPGEAGLIVSGSYERWIGDRVRLRMQVDRMRWFFDASETPMEFTSASRTSGGVGLVRVLSGDGPLSSTGRPLAIMNTYVGAGIALLRTGYHGPEAQQLTSGGVFLLAGLEFQQATGRWGSFVEVQITFAKSIPGFGKSPHVTAGAAGTGGVKVRF